MKGMYEDFLKTLGEKYNFNPKHHIAFSNIIMKETYYLPPVSVVAKGAGYCSKYAYLNEMIGVGARYMKETTRAVGGEIHKLLAIASIKIFRDGKRIDEALKYAEGKLEKELNIRIENSDRDTAKDLLTSLMTQLDSILSIKSAGYMSMEAYPELQLMDYELHLRGYVDLLLEHKNKDFAVVVEWKTYESSPNNSEYAQLIAYSMLVAKRLKMDIKEALEQDKVIPLLIKRKGRKAIVDKKKINEMYDKILTIAQWLTTVSGFYEKYKETRSQYLLQYKGRNTNPFLRFPVSFGKPENQKYPCVIKRKEGKPWQCQLIDACKFYNSYDSAKRNELSRNMWRERFRVLGRKKLGLAVYRALQEWSHAFNIVDNVKDGKGFDYEGKQTLPYPIIKVKQRSFRLDVVQLKDGGGYTLIGERDIRKFETVTGLPFVIPQKKPIFLTNLDAEDPLLSYNLFANIANIEVQNRKVIYTFDIPSKIFKVDILLHKELNRYGEFLIAEADVDLTRLELEAIDAVQRKAEEAGLPVKPELGVDEF